MEKPPPDLDPAGASVLRLVLLRLPTSVAEMETMGLALGTFQRFLAQGMRTPPQ